jgi:hypothetical protein
MPRLSEAAQFDRTIAQLITKRRTYTEGLAQIDAILAKYHIQIGNGSASAAAAPPRNRATTAKSPAAAPARRRGRRSFSQTADEFVLALLKDKQMITGEINAAWKRAGRGGAADNTLGKLVKEKRIKRTPVKDGRGSSYAVA